MSTRERCGGLWLIETKEHPACGGIVHLTSVKGQATRTGKGKKGAKSEVRQG
jgi:hypothetical protein